MDIEGLYLEGNGFEAYATCDVTTGALRTLQIDGVDILEGIPAGHENEMSAGDILIPWPNRVRDGVWVDERTSRQLPVNEPERENALHGLAVSTEHHVSRRSDDRIVLRAYVHDEGYPFPLIVDTTYQLERDGIVVTHDITNCAQRKAPVAVGSHPYIKIGDVPTQDLIVTLKASSRVLVDERLNPIGEGTVEGTRFDLRGGVRVGDLDLDTAYFDIEPDASGRYCHRVTAPDGQEVQVWGDENYKHAQVYTTPNMSEKHKIGWAIAVEPTTAPPNALNSGTDLHFIDPGATWRSQWGIRYLSQGRA